MTLYNVNILYKMVPHDLYQSKYAPQTHKLLTTGPTFCSGLATILLFYKKFPPKQKYIFYMHNFSEQILSLFNTGARCSSMVRAFAHSAISHRIDPSW